MAGPDILVTAGVFAILAAIAGGGLKGAGWEVPLINSTRRQLLLGVVGAILLGLGLVLGERESPSPQRADPPAKPADLRASVEQGLTFRSAQRTDSYRPGRNQGYLVLGATVRLRNRERNSAPVSWEDTKASLLIGGRTVRFHAYYFFTGQLGPQTWFGEDPITPGAVPVAPGTSEQRDIFFMPDQAGQGAYMWDEFLAHLLGEGSNATFRIEVAVDGEGLSGARIGASCQADLRSYADLARTISALPPADGGHPPTLRVRCG